MRLSVIGLGKLGSPMVACFSAKGFTTVGVDINADYVEAVAHGKAPVFEPGLSQMLAEGRACLTATTDTEAAVRDTDVTFVIVPTPSQEDGGFSLDFVLPVMESVGRAVAGKSGYHLVVLTSTVMPGSTGGPVREALEQASGKRLGEGLGLCYSPEFIAIGSVIRDFLNPDFLLIGESDPESGERLAEIYRAVVDNDPPIARLNFVNAELAKIAVNTFVTTKIAFANMLARVCERIPGADVDEVTSTLGMDSRIGSRYLRGAISYGGPCFPRDNVALASLARSVGAPAFVAEATETANRDGIERLADFVCSSLPEGGVAGVLGLSYKPDTDVVEESPGLNLACAIAARGARVAAYDPAAMPNARVVAGDLDYAESAEACVREADVVVVATAWQEFAGIPPETFERVGSPRVLIDCWRILPADQLGDVTYVPLGDGTAVQLALAASG